MRSAFIFLGHSLCVVAALAGCVGPQPVSAQESDDYYTGIIRGLEQFGGVYREILEHYAGSLDPKRLAESAIQGMVGSLDPYSAFNGHQTSGAKRRTPRVGVGVEIAQIDSMITVTEVLDGYSAQSAGLRVGDRIVECDGHNTLHESIDSLYKLLRGDVGSPLTLTIARGIDSNLLFVELKRERITIPSLRYAGTVSDGIVYLRLERFGENAGNEVRTALLRLLHYEGGADNVRGIVLDLRGNSGGILEEAVSIAENFVPRGELIVSTDGRDSSERDSWYSEQDPIALDIPLVILVDQQSASASELLAAAIQDHKLGLIVGRQTAGKGVVQSVIALPFGASLRLTTAWYITPSGRSIQRVDGPERNEIASFIPDSLLRAVHTGTVRGAGTASGVQPDSLVRRFRRTSILNRLVQADAFFDFATRQTALYDSLPPTFMVTDDIYEAFVEESLSALSRAERESGVFSRLDSLSTYITDTRGNLSIDQLFEGLRKAIAEDDMRGFTEEQDQIRRRLEMEIRRRFLGEKEGIRAGLENDRQAMTAIGLLKNSIAYERLLNRN